jgi:hypothetical protein
VHPDTIVNAIRPRVARRVVGCDNEGFVIGPTQMLEDTQH